MTALLDTTAATRLPGVVAQTPATRPDLRRYRIFTSTELQSRGEAAAMLGRDPDERSIERLAAYLTARRRRAESERAHARALERKRWRGIDFGVLPPLDILEVLWTHPDKNSRAKRPRREGAAA